MAPRGREQVRGRSSMRGFCHGFYMATSCPKTFNPWTCQVLSTAVGVLHTKLVAPMRYTAFKLSRFQGSLSMNDLDDKNYLHTLDTRTKQSRENSDAQSIQLPSCISL